MFLFWCRWVVWEGRCRRCASAGALEVGEALRGGSGLGQGADSGAPRNVRYVLRLAPFSGIGSASISALPRANRHCSPRSGRRVSLDPGASCSFPPYPPWSEAARLHSTFLWPTCPRWIQGGEISSSSLGVSLSLPPFLNAKGFF